MPMKEKRLDTLEYFVAAEETRKLVRKLLSQLRANNAGIDGKRSYSESHNPAVREIAGGREALSAVLASLLGRPEDLKMMIDIIDKE